MAGISISNPSAHGMDGVAFTGTQGGVALSFVVAREALEDLDYSVLETPQDMLQAFSRHQLAVAEGAARAANGAQPGGPAILVQSLLF